MNLQCFSELLFLFLHWHPKMSVDRWGVRSHPFYYTNYSIHEYQVDRPFAGVVGGVAPGWACPNDPVGHP